MKIAITSKGKELNDLLDPRFGRAQYFVIYDLGSKKYEILDNSHINVSGGAGSGSAKTIADSGAEAVISGNFGPNAVNALNAFGIKMYVSGGNSISRVIAAFEQGTLTQVTEATREGSHNG